MQRIRERGLWLPRFYYDFMIDKTELTAVVERALEGSDLFVVEVTVSSDNVIDVALDGMVDVSLDDCIAVDRAVHAAFDQDVDDYELTVGSYGLTSPLRVRRQYDKNVGSPVEVLTADGRKFSGTLSEANDDTFTVLVSTKVKQEGKKRPELVDVPTVLRYDEVKSVKPIIKI